MSILKSLNPDNQTYITKRPSDTLSTESSSFFWDSLFNNVNCDIDTAHRVLAPIQTASERCQVTCFYVQAIIANSSVFLVSNTGGTDSLNLTKSGACWLLGNASSCALSMDHSTVDDCHAVICYMPRDGFSIVDVGSQTGTRLNRRRLAAHKRRQLRNGDMIELGNVMFEFFVDNLDRRDYEIDAIDDTYF